ncbi:MAG: phosphonoacetaldehyde hydrolase [Verrucomicrobia bacterium]|nr:MAG: phosphonoacetaldehyde hydrolase [Verrucomicrobiota bacterium]
MEHVKLPELIIFDWAGTLVDFGCCAPLAAFCRAFENAGLPISDETARGPMGSHKRDHVREILHDPEVAERVRRQLGREPDEALVQAIYDDFAALLPAELPVYGAAIPGVVEALDWLRERRVRIGSTTGYTRAMMDVLEPVARASGVVTEVLVCADEVSQGRPAPWACFRIAERLGVYPMAGTIKIGDTPADMKEGRNAGMMCIGLSECGNEVGLGREALDALSAEERQGRIWKAEQRLLESGADVVLKSVAELPAWLEARGA